MQLPGPKDFQWYERVNATPPSHDEHGLTDTYEQPLSEQLLDGHARNWRLEGNLLKCDTDFGPLEQWISPNYICLGDSKDGLPILKKIV